MVRVVVTGASGNVGTGVLRRLGARVPEAEVIGLCRRAPALDPPFDRVSWREIDLTSLLAGEELRRAFAGVDAVVHLAWAIQPVRHEQLMQRVNVGGTNTVLDAVVDAEVPHLVYASSLGVYAPGGRCPVTEEWPATGQRSSAYSRHKVTVERTLDRFEKQHPDTVVSRVRPTLVAQRDAAAHIAALYFGPLVPAAVFRLLRAGVLRSVPMPAGLCLQFVHADDVGDAVVSILQRRVRGVYNLAANELNLTQLAGLVGARPLPVPGAILRAVVTALYRARVLAVSPGWFDVATRTPVMDTARARTVLGWQPAHSSEQAAKRCSIAPCTHHHAA
jgi:nucleoside-diphosphate-sugar epimerase